MEKNVEIKVEVLDKNKFIMRQYLGEANGSAGEVYELNSSIGSGAPIIKMPEGEIVMFSWESLIKAARKAVEESNEE